MVGILLVNLDIGCFHTQVSGKAGKKIQKQGACFVTELELGFFFVPHNFKSFL